MSHPIVEKYRTLHPINDEDATHKLLAILIDLPQDRLSEHYGASSGAGRFYLFRHESVPGKVIEYVPDHHMDSSVTTLYLEHPIFESRQRLVDTRAEIISAIDHLLLAVPNTTTVRDEGRSKEFSLRELGTAQLLDVLEHFAR